MQVIGFARHDLRHDPAHDRCLPIKFEACTSRSVFAGFIVFNLLMNAGPNSTTRLRWLLSSFRLNCGRQLAASPLVLPKSERPSASSSCQS